MSDTTDTDNDPRPTRLKLFNELVIKKDVKAQSGQEFKNGIQETLEEILAVSRASLSVAESAKFDLEANEFYSYVPQCLKKAGRNKKRMKNRFKVYFDKVISLETVQVGYIPISFWLLMFRSSHIFVFWFLVDTYQKTKKSAVKFVYLKKDQARFRFFRKINKFDS